MSRTVIRKSWGFGPFLLTLSPSGIGISFGMFGLRFGISPKGKLHVSFSKRGLHYRKSIGSVRRNRK